MQFQISIGATGSPSNTPLTRVTPEETIDLQKTMLQQRQLYLLNKDIVNVFCYFVITMIDDSTDNKNINRCFYCMFIITNVAVTDVIIVVISLMCAVMCVCGRGGGANTQTYIFSFTKH